MDKTAYLKKLRLFLADPDGKIWDDVELYTLLDKALKKYCIDSGCFVSNFDFYPDHNGYYHYPDGFGAFFIGWNDDGTEIIPVTGRELFVRSNHDMSRTGDVKYIYDDLDSYGNFSCFPVPGNMQNTQQYSITPHFGEVFDNDYGVFTTADYGTTLTVDRFDYAGTLFYYKIGDYQDVKDYMAIISYALNLAYTADSDFANAELAAHWKNIYKSRLGVFGRVKHNNIGRTVAENFY